MNSIPGGFHLIISQTNFEIRCNACAHFPQIENFFGSIFQYSGCRIFVTMCVRLMECSAATNKLSSKSFPPMSMDLPLPWRPNYEIALEKQIDQK